MHTCRKLLTEICEIWQILIKSDLIKFREIFTKITLKLSQNSQKPLFKCKKFVTNIIQSVIYVYFIKRVVKWSEISVRFEKIL